MLDLLKEQASEQKYSRQKTQEPNLDRTYAIEAANAIVHFHEKATLSFTPRKYLALAMEYCYGKVEGEATPTGHYHIAQAQAMIFF